jgi:V/A-type H+-transporting ATPase subunit E
MEMELKNLIDRIKEEGVLEADKASEAIIKKAEEKAGEIIASADKEKSAIISDARAKADSFRKNSEKAMKQAARDVLLTLREDVTAFFDRVVKGKISGQLSPNVLKEAIVTAVNNLRKDGILDIEVLVSKEDRDKLEKTLFSSFGSEVKGHIKLKGTKSVEKGFRIGERGKDSYFDFTDEAIAEAFKKYLNPKLVEMLDIDLGLGKNKKNV